MTKKFLPQWPFILLIFIISVLLFVFLGQERIIVAKGEWLSRRFSADSESEIIRRLEEEKNDLEAKIFNLEIQNQEFGHSFIPAKVYSLYPFSNRSELIINVGDSRGINLNQAVTVGNKILIGRVKNVYQNISVVQTVFDPEFQIPVRIGEEEVDALLVGGLSPKATLVEAPEIIKPDDFVFSSYREFPYGLIIGQIKEIALDKFNPEVRIKPIYEFKKIRDVLVVFN